eukprot:m.116623 g.116623  ORF g.116623 m.116623 type:complete len:649 (-) comp16383_c0_seq1:55-2001(-)
MSRHHEIGAGDAAARSYLLTHQAAASPPRDTGIDPDELKKQFESELAAQAMRIFPEGGTVASETPDDSRRRHKSTQSKKSASPPVDWRHSKEGDAGARSYLVQLEHQREQENKDSKTLAAEDQEKQERWSQFTAELAQRAGTMHQHIIEHGTAEEDHNDNDNDDHAAVKAAMPTQPPPPQQQQEEETAYTMREIDFGAFQQELAGGSQTAASLPEDERAEAAPQKTVPTDVPTPGGQSSVPPPPPPPPEAVSPAIGTVDMHPGLFVLAEPINDQPRGDGAFGAVTDVGDVSPEVKLARGFAPVLAFDRGERHYPMHARKFWQDGEVFKSQPSSMTKVCCPGGCCASACYGRLCHRAEPALYQPEKPATEPGYGSDLFVLKAAKRKTEWCKEQMCSMMCCFCCDCRARHGPPEDHEGAVHFKVLQTEHFVVVQYQLFYEYESTDFPWSCCLNRQGGWQHITVVAHNDSLAPHAVYFGAHGGNEGQWRKASDVKWEHGAHPVCYVAQGTHAMYGFESFRGLCCNMSIVPRACCCDNDYTRRVLDAETWRFDATNRDYELVDLTDKQNQEWVQFAGHWGWWMPRKGAPGLTNSVAFTTGDEAHLSSTCWTRLLGQCFGWCYPKPNTPLDFSELRTTTATVQMPAPAHVTNV